MQIRNAFSFGIADTIAGRQHSGIGGHEDFVGGGSMEGDDRSFVCMPATANVGGRVLSRIQATHARGSIITTPRHHLDFVVTEFGVASLRGLTVEERAAALVEIAHPEAREKLQRGDDEVHI